MRLPADLEEMNMRGVHSAVDDIRRNVFTEVARLGYEGGDLTRVDALPYTLIQGEVAHHRHDVFLERGHHPGADPPGPGHGPADGGEADAPLPQHPGGGPPTSGISRSPWSTSSPFACNACPPKQIRITDSCQGCLSHPCMNVCPKDAIYLDKDKHCHIDQDKCIKCGKCFNQCPYRPSARSSGPAPPPAAWTPSAPTSWAVPRSTMTSASPAACAW